MYNHYYSTTVNCGLQRVNHRGLKETELKPLGHLYLGVTHTTMSSAVQTHVKAFYGPVLWQLLCTAAAKITISSVS
jgi:hypothetical protein